ncbi:MAG: hypothetical protein WC342_05775 [Methanoregula sp.]|jgi:hypothetical protein
MAIDFSSHHDSPDRRGRTLSSKTKKRISELIGKCEYCTREYPPDLLEVYQINLLPNPPYRSDDNPANSLIVLCSEHHAQVKAGTISKHALKPKISHRSDKFKLRIRAAIEKYEKPRSVTTGTIYRDPRKFDVYLKDKDAKRSR